MSRPLGQPPAPRAVLGLEPFRLLREAWRGLGLPLELRRAVAPLVRSTIGQYVEAAHRRAIRSAPRFDAAQPQPGPLVLAGFLEKVHGIGVAARQTAAALREAGLAFQPHDLGALDGISAFEHLPFPGGPQGGVLLAHCNPPEYARALAHYGRGALDRWYRIGYWAWEEAELPADWAALAGHFHELWAPSRFVADAILRSAPAPQPMVRVMPHPLLQNTQPPRERSRFGIAEGAFAVLAAFDFRSSRARKNPDAAIAAYRQAFPTPTGRSVLVLKSIGEEADRFGVVALQAMLGKRSDVIWLRQELSEADMACLLQSVDAVLSLHRAEGFGLLLAEAMALGKVAIGTAWSGAADFLLEGASAPVSYRLVPIRDPSGRYGREAGALWAEPDIAAAADWLRRLADDANLRAALGAAGREVMAAARRQFFAQLEGAPWRALVSEAGLQV